MASSFSPNATSKMGPRLTKYSLKNLNRLQRGAGAEDHGHENGRLQRVEYQRIDVQFRDVAEDLAVERLPMSERVGNDTDQAGEPEKHIAEMDERDVRDQVSLERAIEIKKDEEDDDSNDADPELLLLSGVVRHIRRLGLHYIQDGKSFRS
jgi:hypothetical protein